MRLRRFWCALILATLPLTAAAEAPTDEAVLDAFGRIAFGEENVPDADPRIQKWTLRPLYDPALKPGMRRDEALAVAHGVLPKLRASISHQK